MEAHAASNAPRDSMPMAPCHPAAPSPVDAFAIPGDFAPRVALALAAEPFRPEELIDSLRRHPLCDALFAGPGCHGCPFDLATHTHRVLESFERHLGDHPVFERFSKRAFRLALALHDIGKPLAIAAGEPQDEHHVAVIRRLSASLGLGTDLERVLCALVHRDTLGQFLQGRLPLEGAVAQLTERARSSGLEARTFYDLATCFYQADTLGYTSRPGYKGTLDHLYPGILAGATVRTGSGRLLMCAPYEAGFDALEAALGFAKAATRVLSL